MSCSHSLPAGASSTRRVSCGLIHLGGGPDEVVFAILVGTLVGRKTLSERKARKSGLSTLKWRTGRDSNPRWLLHHARFPSVCLKPLGHLSFWARSAALIARRRDRATASFLRASPWLGYVAIGGFKGGISGVGLGSVGDGRRRHRARRIDLVDGRLVPPARPRGPVVASRRPLAQRRAGSHPAPPVVGSVDVGR